MSNSKSTGSAFMVNLVMFIVLVVITFGPPAIIMKDYFDAVRTELDHLNSITID